MGLLSPNGDAVQIILDVLSTLVAAQDRQKAPRENSQTVVIKFKTSVKSPTVRVHPWTGDFEEELLNSWNEMREEFWPVDRFAMELKNVAKRTTLLD